MPTLTTTDQTNVHVDPQPSQTYGDAVPLVGGGWAVTWTSSLGTSIYEMRLQTFGPDGASRGEEYRFGGAVQGAPQMTRLADGSFVVAWTSGSSNNTADVFAQRFTAAGAPDGSTFMLNNGEYRDQRLLELVSLKDGGFVAMWSQPQQDAPTSSPGHNPNGPIPTFVLTAQVYDALGTRVGGYQSLSTPVSQIFDFEAQPLPGGGFLLVREAFVNGRFGLEAQAYGASAQPVGAPLSLTDNGSDPRLAVLADGSFVVAYRRSTAGEADVAVQHFSQSGAEIGPENTLMSDRQAQVVPDVEALPGGGYLVTYYSQAERTETAAFPERYQLYTQRFDAQDNAVGGPLQLSSQNPSTFSPPDLAVAADGTALAVWAARPDPEGDINIVGRLIAPGAVGGPSPNAGLVISSPGPGATLNGGAGDDTLIASQGPDVLTGGGGGDRFVLQTAPWAPVEIKDFQLGVDRIDLRVVLESAGYRGFNPTGDKVIQLTDDGAGGTQLLLDRDGVAQGQPWPDYILHLQGVPTAGLTWAQLNEGAPANQGDPGTAPPPAGGSGHVIISPGPGSTLTGGAGDDTLSASQGPDILTGGAGADTFAYAALPWNAGRITDFAVGTDRLDLSAIFHASGYAGSDPVADGRMRLDSDGAGGTRVYFDKDSPNGGEWPYLVTTLEHVAPTGLTWARLSGGGQAAPPPPPGGSGQVITSPGPGSTLTGGAGDDTLSASQGPDILTGGAGADTFAYAALPWNAGHVTDFALGTDRLDLSAIFQASGYSGADPVADGRMRFDSDGVGGTRVYFDRDAANSGDWPFLVTTLDHVAPAGLTWAQLSGGGSAPPPPSGGSGQVLTSSAPGSTLTGGAGDDTLNASQGPDVLTGGGGNDVFAWANLPWNAGHVTDFTPGSDQLDLRALFQASGYASSDPIGDGRLEFRSNGAGDTQVYFDRDGAHVGDWPFLITTLDHVQPGQIGPQDWLFR